MGRRDKVFKVDSQYLELVELLCQAGKIFGFDGMNGVGKTTFVTKLSQTLTQKGIENIILRYDFFLKPDDQRSQIESFYVKNKIPYEREDTFFDEQRFNGLLIDICRFKQSGKEKTDIQIKNAFDRSCKNLYEDKIFTITSKTTILIEGKYVNIFSKNYDLSFRLINNLKRARKQFYSRVSEHMHTKYKSLRKKCYDLIYLPSYKSYELKTLKNINFFIDLSEYYE
ncbi:hypothetical protein B6D29_00745 [Microgenomates bacterium UTCPR1]|nr:MAG: hypothetical protein B6D29_00745 [Microgenomates bacterium UTCPR1]